MGRKGIKGTRNSKLSLNPTNKRVKGRDWVLVFYWDWDKKNLLGVFSRGKERRPNTKG